MSDRIRGCGCEACISYWTSESGRQVAEEIERLAAGLPVASRSWP